MNPPSNFCFFSIGNRNQSGTILFQCFHIFNTKILQVAYLLWIVIEILLNLLLWTELFVRVWYFLLRKKTTECIPLNWYHFVISNDNHFHRLYMHIVNCHTKNSSQKLNHQNLFKNSIDWAEYFHINFINLSISLC